MATSSQKFQAPKGTRDFYPDQMAIRRYIEGIWRKTSINHGFDEVEGPMFEHLDLYTHKSGPGIVSEIFQVFSGKDEEELAKIRGGASAPYALRPEFTPTLARMVASKADSLPKPIKWFAIPQHFRAERPQRGRLREFVQWNVDFIGDDSPHVDAEVIATAIGALQQFGLTSNDISLGVSDRMAIYDLLHAFDIDPAAEQQVISLIDSVSKLSRPQQLEAAARIGLSEHQWLLVLTALDTPFELDRDDFTFRIEPTASTNIRDWKWKNAASDLKRVFNELDCLGISNWCRPNLSIVRGLAYYTGTVFEIHEATGQERAVAGGGRYDNLIEGFGGPKLPACGFGMGDVVLGNLLHDKGLLSEEHYLQDLRPDAFVIAADDEAAKQLSKIVAELRKQNFHVRHSYKTTRNVGKLLGDASKSRARNAVILGKELAETPPRIVIKNLQSGEQKEAALVNLADELRTTQGQR